MKTFEEAVAATLLDPEMLYQNLRSCKGQTKVSEEWADQIFNIAQEHNVEIAKMILASDATPDNLMAQMCATLQIAFDWGKLVGIEMTKPDMEGFM